MSNSECILYLKNRILHLTLLQLPLDIWTLSESDRKARIESRKPKKAVKIQEEIEDTFDSNKYLKYLKK